MRILLPLLVATGLVGCVTAADREAFPARDDVASAYRAWMNCIRREPPPPDEQVFCAAPVRRVTVTSLACRSHVDRPAAARVLCRFSSVVEIDEARQLRDSECAYFTRDADVWWLDDWPDSELCEF